MKVADLLLEQVESLEQFINAVSRDEVANVILYYNKDRLKDASIATKRNFINRMLPKMHSGSPFDDFGVYMRQASTYGNIRFPSWVRSWNQMANHFKMIAAKHTDEMGDPSGPSDPNADPGEMTQDQIAALNPRDKIEVIRDAFRGFNNQRVILTVMLAIKDNAEWEAMKQAWANSTRGASLLERLKGGVNREEKRRIDAKLESIGSEDRLLDPETAAASDAFGAVQLDDYPLDKQLTTKQEVASYIGALFSALPEGETKSMALWFLSEIPREPDDEDSELIDTPQKSELRKLKEDIGKIVDEQGSITVSEINDKLANLFKNFKPVFDAQQ